MMTKSTNPKLEVYFQDERFLQVLVDDDLTDEFLNFLDLRGKKVFMISYGYFNNFNLISYEV